ncbi:sirohydrochlorin cobaltochelatase [Granulicatella sp. zg-ZJ]|uniref:sirohydrochlorin cobaltochelatase n=1 Tax=unclassified Granulicatella TaxID=2630493 RepID=UPI0013C1A71A|nr:MULTISPECIES: sirohydrochlorin cobaltochelatase [unclassified Granulicatella]MBS4749709.1 sirohydrochlorin cobaltochelatase [Carnobacteriaceae bacterium zg-ZUI78]NEW61838.1 sirohydrochlorin cobaltochelatase [Granulicatella sp. zg-ZJ]NEW65912.1 sirohydrochlorin cobaltochelatase [Granulicatella sp. zg-84]QMI85141.1 sirohydrochlorin cobaltochelatase [Carnobacteriaceae bacterium zg-84]
MTKAILVVSFGTTFPETRKKTIEACENAIQHQFSEYKVYRAFTSNIVIRRILKQEDLHIDTVAQALERMYQEGVTEVYVQPLHMILGDEYEKVLVQAIQFEDKFDVLKIAKPLLSSIEDYEAIKRILLDKYGQFGEETATVLMGHGSQHYAFTSYAAIDHMLMNEPVYVGAVESYPDVELIEERLRQTNVKHVHLAPFMLVAGDHATNDMASDEEDSWYTYFSKKGYTVTAHLIGLGEYKEIQQLYIQHLLDVIA